MLELDSKIEEVKKIGKATATKLRKLDIVVVKDLLTYYPFRYEEYQSGAKISSLMAGQRASITGVVEFMQSRRARRRQMSIIEAIVNDGSGQIKVVWFNQPFISRNIKVGESVSLAGKVETDFAGLVMKSPEYEVGDGKIHTAGLVPVYNLTAGLTSKQLRYFIKVVLPLVAKLNDIVPVDIVAKYKLISLEHALEKIHFPSTQADLDQARRRLQFNELFFVQLAAQLRKLEIQKQKAESIKFCQNETKAFVDSLEFKLTKAQRQASWEILQDISNDQPMSRLLEGDVGSGKTVTAALAMYNTALNKKQSALLVPTEILAQQHYDTLTNLFKDTEVRVGLFTRSSRRVGGDDKLSKKKILDIIKSGKVDIVIGTHAIIQKDVEFNNLALAVVDEQHRFGVEQRRALRQHSGDNQTLPHLLAMTATPIPRSLAQVVYGDLDLSIIDELPAGRKPIQSFLVTERKRKDSYEFIRKEVKAGRQVFVVCPLITASDKLGVKSVEVEYQRLHEQIFSELNIAYLHGRMKSKEKEGIMQDFLHNKTNILVSTAVIEVGVDIPNATVMVIEGAQRFGLAQLHQFRGRVGRSDYQSYCLLFADEVNDGTKNRLNQFVSNNDGFKLAEADLKRRGPGEVYGAAQKGFPDLKLARLDDYVLIKQTKEAVAMIVIDGIERYPDLQNNIDNTDDSIIS